MLSSLHEIWLAGLNYSVSEVEVSLPRSWRVAACQPAQHVLRTQPPATTADLVLDTFADRPYSVQPRGCGARGQGVHLPLHYLQYNYSTALNDNKTTPANFTQPEPESRWRPEQELAQELLNAKFGLYARGLEMFSEDRGQYDRYARTLQNLECGGQSPAAMVPRLSDPVNFTPPAFSYVVSREAHYVLVLDQSSRMDARWTHLRRGLSRLINTLAEGTMLSIVTFGSEGTLVLPPTLVTHHNRQGLHGRVPRRTEAVDAACLSCGLHLARDILRGSGGSVVLMTSTLEAEVMAELAEREEVYTVLYPGDQQVNTTTTSMVYTVQDGSEKSSQLNEILLDVMNRVEEEEIYAKIHESNHLSYEFSGTFIVEEYLRDDITVTLTVDDEEKVEYFEVIDPAGQKNIFSKFEDGMVVLRFPGASPPGIWSYHAKLYAQTSLNRLWVDVVARGRWNQIKVSGLEPSLPAVMDPSSLPVQVLASVGRGDRPVAGAAVAAIISGPGGLQVELELEDTGYADIESGDGVYSAYLDRFASQPGYYAVSIRATDKAGGAHTATEEGAHIPTGSFSRYTTAPSFYIGFGVEPTEDVIPPARITDLAVMEVVMEVGNGTVNSTQSQLALTWTAPGDDYTRGTVDRYEIRCHTNPQVLEGDTFTSQGILVNYADHAPAPGGGQEQSVIKVPWTNEAFYFAVTAFDRAGNRAGISNLVEVLVTEEVTEKEGLAEAGEEAGQTALRTRSWFLDRSQIYMIGGIAGGVLLIIVLLVIAIILRAKRLAGGRSKTAPATASWAEADTYEAGFSKAESRVETESGIYSWLESLPRSESGLRKKGCEEGSNSSRPTTSTDDSISDSGEQPRVGAGGCDTLGCYEAGQADELPRDLYAQQVLTRSLYYYSYREPRRSAASTNQQGPPGAAQGMSGAQTPDPDHGVHQQYKKKRHESIV